MPCPPEHRQRHQRHRSGHVCLASISVSPETFMLGGLHSGCAGQQASSTTVLLLCKASGDARCSFSAWTMLTCSYQVLRKVCHCTGLLAHAIVKTKNQNFKEQA